MLHLEGKFFVVVYGYDAPPLTCFGPLSSEWRRIHSSVILHTIWAGRTLVINENFQITLMKWLVVEEQIVKLTAVHRCFSNITNSSCFHNITDNEFLDCLVLWHATSTIGATNWFYVTAVVFASSSITSLLRLKVRKTRA